MNYVTRCGRHISFACLVVICLLFGSRPAMAIVAGTNADWTLYPWLAKNVAMLPGHDQWVSTGCSSVIIDQYHALTAGHCLNGPYTYKVGLMFANGKVIEVAQEIRHPNYSRDSQNKKSSIGIISESTADIGLQRLSEAASTANGAQIYNIFNNEAPQQPAGSVAKVLGWGATQQMQIFLPVPDKFSPTLQQLDVLVQNNGTCQAALDGYISAATGGIITQSPFRFNDSLACASTAGLPSPPAGLAGVCDGDTGPLFIASGSKPLLVGFVTDYLSKSLEFPCGHDVDIYTKVAPYLPWISGHGHSCDGAVDDLSARVKVSQNGFGFNRALGLWAATVTVQNNSMQTISGPVQLVLNQVTPGVVMSNNSGVRNGNPYITVLRSGLTLAPGSSIGVSVQFSNPNNFFINYTSTVVGGCSE